MKHFTIDNITTGSLPDPCKGVSPMTEARFVELGGTITDDGEPTPQEKFLAALDSYLDELEAEAERLALDITKEEFIEAAANSKMSTDLVEWAREKQVPDEMIDKARSQVLTFLADAQRPEIGLTWADIFPKPEVGE